MCSTIGNYHGPIMPDMVTDREGDHSEKIDADFVSHYRVSGKRRSGKRGLQIHFDWMSAWGAGYKPHIWKVEDLQIFTS